MFRHRVGFFVAIVMTCLVAALVLWFFSARGHVAIIDIEMIEPGVVQLSVASCGGAPEADVADQIDGRYSVEVRTTQSWDRGNDCADLIEIAVDPDLKSLEIFDTKRGVVFELPKRQVADALDIDGVWRMVEVNGEAVAIGVNTSKTPEIEIQAGFLSGQLGCNRASAELLRDGTHLRSAGLESQAELCGIPDGSEEMVLTELTLRKMLESADGIELTRTDRQMIWVSGSNQVVFEQRR